MQRIHSRKEELQYVYGFWTKLHTQADYIAMYLKSFHKSPTLHRAVPWSPSLSTLITFHHVFLLAI